MTISFILGDTGVIPPALEIVTKLLETTSRPRCSKLNFKYNDLEAKFDVESDVADKSYYVNENKHETLDIKPKDAKVRDGFRGKGKVVWDVVEGGD